MSVLGTTVFKVPELGELGYKLDQANEAKIKAAREKLEKTVQATGAEKAYADNAMGLTGIYKQIADAEYANFRDAAIRFEETGSSKDEQLMRQAAGELNYAVTAGRAILTAASEEYSKNKSNGFKDVALDPTQAGLNYSDFTNRTGVVVNKNGRTYVKDGDAFVPAVNSTFLQSAVNPNNSFILPRTVEQGKYVNFRSYLNDQGRAITAGESVADAQERVDELYNVELKKPAFLEDVVVAYAMAKLGGDKSGEGKIDSEEYASMLEYLDDETTTTNAIEWYRERLRESVPPLWQSSRRSGIGGSGASVPTLNIRPSLSIAETRYVEDGKMTSEDVSLDGYMAFPKTGAVIGTGYASAGSGNKYNIVGIGFKDGKVVANRQVAEDADYFSLETGKNYTSRISPITVDEFDALPEKTRIAIANELERKGIKIERDGKFLTTDYKAQESEESTGFDPNSYKQS